MPIFKKSPIPTTPAPKVRNSGQVGKNKGFNSQKIKSVSARRRPIEGLIYGEELFEPIIKKEKSIVVGFYPFTENNLRISKDGKFIIEKFDFMVKSIELSSEGLFADSKTFEIEDHWNLYYFKTPINDFDHEKDKTYTIIEASCQKFDDFSTVEDLAQQIISLVRAEFFNERQQKLEELRKEEENAKIEKERLEKLEEQQNEAATNETSSN